MREFPFPATKVRFTLTILKCPVCGYEDGAGMFKNGKCPKCNTEVKQP